MSHAYYRELWLIARKDLDQLLELDQKVQDTAPRPSKDDALSLTLPLYLRYRNLVKRLIVCHDQMVQTQKRQLIKRVLDGAIGRMLEYKREIVNLDCSEYQWPDDLLNQLKYTYDDVEIAVTATAKEVIQKRRKQFEEMIENAQQESIQEETPEESTQESKESLPRRRRKVPQVTVEVKPDISEYLYLHETPEQRAEREAREAAEKAMQEAILLIQSHERARVARVIGIDARRSYEYKRKLRMGEIEPKKIDVGKTANAILTIQRAWRRYAARKAWKKRIAKLEALLGMTIPPWQSRDVFEEDEKHFQKKLELMPTSIKRVEETTDKERARLLKVRGPGLIEDITDEIREWFIIWYNELGHFDVYPAANLGGSVLIATGQSLTPEEYVVQKRAEEAAKAGGGAEVGPPGAAKRTSRKAAGWKMPRSQAFNVLEEANKDFIDNWSFRDQSNSSQLQEYVDLIKDKLCYELQLEMREIVDELMRLELEKLNAALKKDYAADNRPITFPLAEKGKKKRRGNRRGRRRRRDPMEDVPVEDLFKELVRAEIIRSYPVTSLQDWIGDASYQNYEASLELRDYQFRMGEIRQVIMEHCILPLASKEVHRIAPLTRSACICGPTRCGKSFLANAICTEVGALLIDMTPYILVDKYEERKDERKLIKMISKVARVYAPSIIFIDNGEMVWWKKVPPEERYYKPKRFARYYPRLVKSIKRGDQILFLTTTSEPYKATTPFLRIHDKYIMIPLSDYNTLYMYYKHLLMKYPAVDRNFDISCLAKLSVGIHLEYIRHSIEKVLNLRRRMTLKFKPLAVKEIMEEILAYEHATPKMLNQLVAFEGRTALGRRRKRMLAAEAAAKTRGRF